MYFNAFFIILFGASILGCSSAGKFNTDTAEGAFAQAEKYRKDERFDEAITYYSEVKNKHPYNSLATESELKIADIEFERENYLEAETAYKIFLDFHPDHAQIPYVTYRLGLSVTKQLPSTIDRDLVLANRAIEYFDKIITTYNKSEYAKSAVDEKLKARQMLADKDLYIAEYYFIREIWLSALGRYEDVIKKHPGLGHDSKALYGASLSAYRLKDLDKAKLYFKRLLSEHPESKELAAARKEMADGF